MNNLGVTSHHPGLADGPIYLDYNATRPVDPRVAETTQPYLTTHFGNPSRATPKPNSSTAGRGPPTTDRLPERVIEPRRLRQSHLGTCCAARGERGECATQT